MPSSILDALYIISGRLPLLFVWVAGGIAIMNYRCLTSIQRYIALLVWFDVLSESVTTIFYYVSSNIFLIPVVLVGEAGCLLFLYSQAIQLTALRKGAPWIFGFLTIYVLVEEFLSSEKINFWPELHIVCGLLEIGLVSLYFRKLMNELQVDNLGRDPLFIISVGLLLYLLGDLLVVLFSNYLHKNFSREVNMNVWHVHTTLNSMLYLCYCLALWMRPPKPSS